MTPIDQLERSIKNYKAMHEHAKKAAAQAAKEAADPVASSPQPLSE